MNDHVFSGILLGSGFAVGCILYFFVSVLLNRRGTVSLKIFNVVKIVYIMRDAFLKCYDINIHNNMQTS